MHGGTVAEKEFYAKAVSSCWTTCCVNVFVIWLVIVLFNSMAGLVGGMVTCSRRVATCPLGFLTSITLPLWWSIASLPLFALAYLLKFFAIRKTKTGVAITVFVMDFYNSFLMTGWMAVVFLYCADLMFLDKIPEIPLLLFSCSVATSPFLYMAKNEPLDNYGTTIEITLILIGSMLTVILLYFGYPLIYPLIILCTLMLIKTFSLTVACFLSKIERQPEY